MPSHEVHGQNTTIAEEMYVYLPSLRYVYLQNDLTDFD
jgi:hypothetical protein